MGQSKHHKGRMDGWMDGGWVGMKHFSVGFQFPGSSHGGQPSGCVYQRWAGITNSFGFQAGSQFDSDTENQRFSLWVRIDTLKTGQVSEKLKFDTHVGYQVNFQVQF